MARFPVKDEQSISKPANYITILEYQSKVIADDFQSNIRPTFIGMLHKYSRALSHRMVFSSGELEENDF